MLSKKISSPTVLLKQATYTPHIVQTLQKHDALSTLLSLDCRWRPGDAHAEQKDQQPQGLRRLADGLEHEAHPRAVPGQGRAWQDDGRNHEAAIDLQKCTLPH